MLLFCASSSAPAHDDQSAACVPGHDGSTAASERQYDEHAAHGHERTDAEHDGPVPPHALLSGVCECMCVCGWVDACASVTDSSTRVPSQVPVANENQSVVQQQYQQPVMVPVSQSVQGAMPTAAPMPVYYSVLTPTQQNSTRYTHANARQS